MVGALFLVPVFRKGDSEGKLVENRSMPMPDASQGVILALVEPPRHSGIERVWKNRSPRIVFG